MTEVQERELPVKKISIPPIYWPPAPKLPPVDDWPPPPNPDIVIFRVESPLWSGHVGVRTVLVNCFGPARAIQSTLWGKMLEKFEGKLQPMFEKFGRFEVRRDFIRSIRCYDVDGNLIESPVGIAASLQRRAAVGE